MSAWTVVDTEDDLPPLGIWRRSDIDELARRRGRALEHRNAEQRHRQVNEDEAAGMVADYRAGLAVHKIEMSYGRSRPTVMRVLREAGIEVRRRGGTDGLAATG